MRLTYFSWIFVNFEKYYNNLIINNIYNIYVYMYIYKTIY